MKFMNKAWLSIFVILIAVLPVTGAPVLGPDVAVMTIKIGKEKALQRVVIGLYDQAAPLTVENFKELIGRKYYNGMRFHRVFPDTLVQTGDPKSRHGQSDASGTGGPGYTIPCEIGLKHALGAVAMARLPDKINPAKASNGGQFYACLRAMPELDGKFTVFGEILEGLEGLQVISNERSDSNDFPLKKIVIKSIKLEPRVATAQ